MGRHKGVKKSEKPVQETETTVAETTFAAAVPAEVVAVKAANPEIEALKKQVAILAEKGKKQEALLAEKGKIQQNNHTTALKQIKDLGSKVASLEGEVKAVAYDEGFAQGVKWIVTVAEEKLAKSLKLTRQDLAQNGDKIPLWWMATLISSLDFITVRKQKPSEPEPEPSIALIKKIEGKTKVG